MIVLRPLLFVTAFSMTAALTGVTAAAPLPAAHHQKQVLTLYSMRPEGYLATLGDREFPRIFADGLGSGVDYYSEFIDQGRFDQPEYVAAFRDFLRLKYKGRSFDLVMAIDETSIAFVERYRRDEMFQGPVVFFSTTSSSRRPARSTGLIAETNFRGTIELVAGLQPDTRNIFVVAGASDGNVAFERSARRQLASFGSRFAFTYLSGLPAKRLEERVSHLPPHSIVYYLVVERDADGNSFVPLDYLDRLTAVANAPVYSWVDSTLEHGIVGGGLKDQLREVRALAAVALRVLRGEPAESIPVAVLDLNVKQVDWRQLRRWRIDQARVPAGTLVRFREPSLWERYRAYIEGAIALMLGQSVLIAGLLFERRRRRAAEEQAIRSRAALRVSFNRIRDLGGRLLKAQESERSRIARELHDDIGQQVALLTIDLELLRTAQPAASDEALDKTLICAHQLRRSVHDLSHRLHPSKLRLFGLVPALEVLHREVAREDLVVTFTHDNVPADLSPDLSLCLYRIAQEALQNSVKYSKASLISVNLCTCPHGLELTIADDGVGFDLNRAWGRGLGLISMEERLEPFGASLAIRSAPGAGTRLAINVPLPAETTRRVAV